VFITINIDPSVVEYLDSVCGGMPGRSHYINQLIVADYQNQPAQPVQTYPEQDPDNTYNITTPRLHRRQSGFPHPEAPIKPRERYGSIRRPRQSTSLKRGGG
jgi:hypothetical protein